MVAIDILVHGGCATYALGSEILAGPSDTL